MNLYLKDSEGKPSVSTTLAVAGVVGAFLKLFLAGFVCCGLKFSDFSGADFAMVVSPFLAMLAHKRQVEASKDKAE